MIEREKYTHSRTKNIDTRVDSTKHYANRLALTNSYWDKRGGGIIWKLSGRLNI